MLKGRFTRLNGFAFRSCSLWIQSWRRPPPTFSSFIKQSSYKFIIVQILSYIWNSDWPVTSKGIWGDLVQVHKVLLCWRPLVSILHPGGNTCNVWGAIRSTSRSVHCLKTLHWISECFDQKLSCYASPNPAECILLTFTGCLHPVSKDERELLLNTIHNEQNDKDGLRHHLHQPLM